jgi:colanic acid/amylovoran biosynthesis glycosyltransferase
MVLKGVRYPKALYRMLRILNERREKRSTLRERVVVLFRLLPFVGLKPDVLHFQWNSTAIECACLFDFFQCPTLVSCRGSQINVAPLNPQRSTIRDSLRESFARATAVHCVSEAIKQQATEYGLDSSKARIIRPAVDPDFFLHNRSLARKTAPFRLLSVGSLVWVKGYEYALLSVRRLLDSGLSVQFDIVGVGPERQRILYTVHDLGLVEHVHLLGKLSPTEIREQLASADAFLLSSVSEGISNAVLEAMASGLPVVTTDCGGMREVLRDGIEGFVVPVRDVNAMAEALRRIAADEELASRLARAARQRVECELNLKEQSKQFLQLYAHLVEGSAGAC